MDYRFKVTSSMRDQLRLHPKCAAGLPVDTRERDRRMLFQWMKDETLSTEAAEMLTATLGLLDA